MEVELVWWLDGFVVEVVLEWVGDCVGGIDRWVIV